VIGIIAKENDYKVYVHVNMVNGKRYVGITKQALHERWRDGKGYRHCPYFYHAIKKYGWDMFQHELVADNLTEDGAKELEIK